MEKDDNDGKDAQSGSDTSPRSINQLGILKTTKPGFFKEFLHSFTRDPNASLTNTITLSLTQTQSHGQGQPTHAGADGKVYDVEAAAQRTATSPLARRLKGRHLQMIAIGGSIGMSPFCPTP